MTQDGPAALNVNAEGSKPGTATGITYDPRYGDVHFRLGASCGKGEEGLIWSGLGWGADWDGNQRTQAVTMLI